MPTHTNPITVDPEALRAARNRRQLTQTEASRQIGISQPVLSQFETGRAQPSLATFFSLALLYHVDAYSLIREVPAESAA